MTRGPDHIPVLLDEVLDLLAPARAETYVDATAGLGGHAAGVARALGPGSTIVLNDLDPANLARAERAVREVARDVRIVPINASFAGLLAELERRSIQADMLLADLGFASVHVDDPARGFSFRAADAPLDMRYDPASTLTAADLVASMSERELTELIREFGEDRHAARIARKLVEARQTEPITTTGRLARVVRSACAGARGGDGIDSATRTFQAFRIAVNDEIGSLQALLAGIERASVRAGQGPLASGARIAIISFHSLEDRPVKQTFKRMVESGRALELTKGPVRASARETDDNPRARSAKLRAVRLAHGGEGRTPE